MANVINLQNLSKMYGFGESSVVALDGVNLEVEKGEFVAIMGPSGSGKSTLMNLIGLLDRASHGTYKLDGKDVSKLRPRRRARVRRDHVGFIFQSSNLISNLNVIENVALPLAYKGITMVRRLKKSSEVLEKVGLKNREYYFPRQLSGGQAQRVAIARALVNWPSIVLADEPTGNLDSATSLQIMELLKDIHEGGNTILMVTHNPELTRYASRVIYMRDGQIEYDEELKEDEAIDLSDVPAAVEYEQELLGKKAPKRRKKARAKKGRR
jgi:putative ABC transport system ATP-binding protein